MMYRRLQIRGSIPDQLRLRMELSVPEWAQAEAPLLEIVWRLWLLAWNQALGDIRR